MRNSMFEALAGVALILHAGDVGGDPVLDALSAIAPVRAVSGNVDPWNPRLKDRVHMDLGGLSIHMSHGHELGSPTPARLLARYTSDVIVYGHTHRALVHRDGTRLVVNPGSAGPRRFGLRPSVAKLTITGGVADVEILELPT
ncbi:MAG: metallophosphoesterase family protein [Acidobacteriota bacterium]